MGVLKKKIIFAISTLILLIVFTACKKQNETKAINPTKVEPLILTNCSLIDGTGAGVKKNINIAIEDGKIKEIGNFEIPEDIKVIDVGGRYVLPGFINAHVHLAYDPVNLKNWAKSGVTTVRDLSPLKEKKYLEKRDLYNTDLANAFIVSASPIIAPKKPKGYGTIGVDSPEEAKKVVEDLAAKGVDIIKLAFEDEVAGVKFEMLGEAEAKEAVQTAHKYNLWTSVHVTHAHNLDLALSSGADDFAHMVREPVDKNMMQRIVDKGIYWEPTLELFQVAGQVLLERGILNKEIMKKRKVMEILLNNLNIFYTLGGKVALGTDFGGLLFFPEAQAKFDEGFPITEVKLMKQAGMSNMDIIISGTKNAAAVCSLDKEIGTIEVGKKADILIVDGNPLNDIENLEKTSVVIHSGYIVVEN